MGNDDVVSKDASRVRDWRRRKREAEARAKVLFAEDTDRVSSSEESVELTDDNIAKVIALRDAIGDFTWDSEENLAKSKVFASISFLLAASSAIKEEASKLGIPVTHTGICFEVDTPGDLDLAIAQFWEFAKVANNVKESVLKVERKKPQKKEGK